MYISRYVHRAAQQGQVRLIAHKIRYTECMGSMDTLAPTISSNLPTLSLITFITIACSQSYIRMFKTQSVGFLFLSSPNSHFHISGGDLNYGSACWTACVKDIELTEELHELHFVFIILLYFIYCDCQNVCKNIIFNSIYL